MILVVSLLAMPLCVCAEQKIYKFGVVPQQAIRKVAQSWLPLTQYLERTTGYTIRFATAKNIPTFEKVLSEGGYDFAYMNPYHYTVYSRSSGYQAFAKARDKKIKGIFVVRQDSQIKSLSDLNNSTLAFPSPLAFAASMLPRATLAKQNIVFTPKYVNSHDSVYRNVVQGNYPAGGGVLRTFRAIEKSVQDQLRILHTTDGYTPHAFASLSAVPAEVVEKIQAALIALEGDADNGFILKKIKIKGIAPAVDSDWDDVRALDLSP